MEDFKNLGLSDRAIRVLEKKGFTKPTTIQAKVIPLLLEGNKDIVGQSQTGTGKTASFALPIIEKLEVDCRKVQAIILTPTRELAIQVAKEIDSLKGDKDLTVLAVYGGSPINVQRQKLRGNVDIVVGTPGRVMDLQRRKSLIIDHVRYAVLDEADEMLNMGFVEDIESILESAPKDKVMLLFSATMPKPILNIAKRYMRKYEFIEVEKAQITTKDVRHFCYDVNAKDRPDALKRIIDFQDDFYGIVFCNTKVAVDSLAQSLRKMGVSAAALHGDISQDQRERILQDFRNKKTRVLVATDVAARGIDVNDLTHVVNFSLPPSPESYVHRIGRTGRAGKKGTAITFVIPSEKRKLGFIERANNCKIIKKTLPSIHEVIKNKEDNVTAIINNIIKANEGKRSRYGSMAEGLLKDHSPVDVISAILKYNFKRELELSAYKAIPEARASPRDRPRQNQRRDRFKKRPQKRRRDNGQRNDRKPKNQGRPGSKR